MIRLTQTELKRIDPETKVIKETLLLADITHITLNSDRHIVIQFKNHPAEFYECVDAHDFVGVLQTRCSETKPTIEKQNCKK